MRTIIRAHVHELAGQNDSVTAQRLRELGEPLGFGRAPPWP
jgi:hypothetical protein